MCGVEYDSLDSSSRPPVLCDPSSPPRLVVGDAVLCVLTLEMVTGRWWMSTKTRDDRQVGGLIDGQSAIETVTDSQWTLRKIKRTDRQTERQLVVETMTDSWRKNKSE